MTLEQRAIDLLCRLGMADETGEFAPLPSDVPDNVRAIVAVLRSAQQDALKEVENTPLKECDCCGKMKINVEPVAAFGMDTSACEGCRDPQGGYERINVRRRMDSMGR
jgi:hypothetical protein